MNGLVKRSAVRAFEIFGSLAVILNVLAAVAAIKRDTWGIALGYIVIAAAIAAALAMHFYVRYRQVPYRWRDEGWGLERWRENRHADDPDDEDVYGEGLWDDHYDERDRDRE